MTKKRFVRHLPVLPSIACLPLVTSLMSPGAFAQDRMDRGMDRGDRRGVGIGTGIGIGIDVLGGALSNQPPQQPGQPAPRVKKAAPTTVQQTFVGKPDAVVHNPRHSDGTLGKMENHQPAIIDTNSKFFERRYYSDQNHNWFWYDLPLGAPKNTDVVFDCPLDSDNCHPHPPGPGPIGDSPGGDNPGGEQISTAPPDTPCGPRHTIARHAYSVCVGTVWNIRTDNYYCCPPVHQTFVTTTNAPTKQACGAGTNTGGADGDPPPQPETAGPTNCPRPESIQPPMSITYCNGKQWVTRIYQMVKCQNGAELPESNYQEDVSGECGDGVHNDPPFSSGKCP